MFGASRGALTRGPPSPAGLAAVLLAEVQARAGPAAPFAVGVEGQVMLPQPAGLGEAAQLELQLPEIVQRIRVIGISGDGALEAPPCALLVARRLLEEC